MKIVLNVLSKCVTIVFTIFCKANPPTYLSLHLGCEGILENSLALGVVHLALALVAFVLVLVVHLVLALEAFL